MLLLRCRLDVRCGICRSVYVQCGFLVFFFFFKQKTAYEMRISDWSSDVCSSDLAKESNFLARMALIVLAFIPRCAVSFMLLSLRCASQPRQIGRASCRERVCQYV